MCVFQYGRQNIENVKRDLEKTEQTPIEDDIKNSQQNIQQTQLNNSSNTISNTKKLPNGNGYLPNGDVINSHSNGGNTVISRDALILVPDGESGDSRIGGGGADNLLCSSKIEDENEQVLCKKLCFIAKVC